MFRQEEGEEEEEDQGQDGAAVSSEVMAGRMRSGWETRVGK